MKLIFTKIYIFIIYYYLFFNSSMSFTQDNFISNDKILSNQKISFKLNMLGLNVAEMALSLENINSNIICVKGINYTLPEISSIYFISNIYNSYFTYNDVITLYHEELYNESKINDFIIYTNIISENKFIMYSKLSNIVILETNYSIPFRSVAAILFYLRKLNYDYYINNNVIIEIPYFYLRHVKFPKFKADYLYNYKTNIRTIFLLEIDGDNRKFKILDDEYRTPIYFSYPAFKIFGIGVINLEGNLNYYSNVNSR